MQTCNITAVLGSLSVCLPVCLPLCPSVCLSTSVCLCASRSVCPPLCLSVCLPVSMSVCLPGCIPFCQSALLYVYLTVCLSVLLPVCLTACLSACLRVCLPVCLSEEGLADYLLWGVLGWSALQRHWEKNLQSSRRQGCSLWAPRVGQGPSGPPGTPLSASDALLHGQPPTRQAQVSTC